MGSLDDNLITMVAKCLTSKKQTPQILKNCIFTLSNLMADKSIFLQQILNLGIVNVLVKIWRQVIEMEKHTSKNEQDDLVLIKNEILYCIGNCTLGVRDTLSANALSLLK